MFTNPRLLKYHHYTDYNEILDLVPFMGHLRDTYDGTSRNHVSNPYRLHSPTTRKIPKPKPKTLDGVPKTRFLTVLYKIF